MEVGEVAAKCITHQEATTQRILILTQREDAARWHGLARAQSPSSYAPPRVREQRPASATLLPCGAHVVPAAIPAEGSEEGRVVPEHHERDVHRARRWRAAAAR